MFNSKMSNYPGGFKNGVMIRGVPLVQTHPGKVFWVGNAALGSGDAYRSASDGNQGSFNDPFSTIDKAINSCRANKGDVIFVKPGHAETLALLEMAPDVAGVAIIGLGSGTNRPTLTMSANASSIVIAGANTVMQNFLVKLTADTTIVVEVTASDVQIVDCEFRAALSPAKEWVDAIDIGGAAANACDRTVVSGCKFTSPAVGSTAAIKLSEISEGVIIENCSVFGNFSVAPIHNPTSVVCTNLTVRDCYLKNLTTAQLALELVSATTGFLVRNFYATDVAGIGGVDPGSCNSFETFACDAIDVSGALAPTITT